MHGSLQRRGIKRRQREKRGEGEGQNERRGGGTNACQAREDREGCVAVRAACERWLIMVVVGALVRAPMLVVLVVVLVWV